MYMYVQVYLLKEFKHILPADLLFFRDTQYICKKYAKFNAQTEQDWHVLFQWNKCSVLDLFLIHTTYMNYSAQRLFKTQWCVLYNALSQLSSTLQKKGPCISQFSMPEYPNGYPTIKYATPIHLFQEFFFWWVIHGNILQYLK